jgi:hypothetical protein
VDSVPGTAADNTLPTVASRSGVSIPRVTLVAVIQAVFRPFKHVPVHVEKPPGVCLETVVFDTRLSDHQHM